MKKLITLFLVFVSLFGALSFLVAPDLLAQTPVQDVCKGVALTGGTCQTGANQNSVEDTIQAVINILSLVIGFVSIIMIMIGGFRYITSAGDSNSTTAAKNTILYAVIGLVVVAMAQVIARFVINRVG